MFSFDFNVGGSNTNTSYNSSTNHHHSNGSTNGNFGFSMGMGTSATTTTTTTYNNNTSNNSNRNNSGASMSIGFGAPAIGVSFGTTGFETPDKQGNLRKFAVGRSFGGPKNWKERYFITNGATLTYAFMAGSQPMRPPCRLCERSQLITQPTPNDHPAVANPAERMFLVAFYEDGIERKLLLEAANPVAKSEWLACLAARVGWVDGQRTKRFAPAVVVSEPPPKPVVEQSVVVATPTHVVVSPNSNVAVEVHGNDAVAASMMAAGAATVAAAGMVGAAATVGAGAGGSVSFESNTGSGATNYYGTTTKTTYYSSSSRTTDVDFSG